MNAPRGRGDRMIDWLEERLPLSEWFAVIAHFGFVSLPLDTRRPLRELLRDLDRTIVPDALRGPQILATLTGLLFAFEAFREKWVGVVQVRNRLCQLQIFRGNLSHSTFSFADWSLLGLLTYSSGSSNRKDVTPLILWMPCMTAHQSKSHLMFRQQLIQLLPMLLVGDWDPLATVLPTPAVTLPAWQPFRRPFSHIRAVGHNLDTGSSTQSVQTFDNSLQFHPVVCCQQFSAAEFRFLPRCGMTQDTAPTTWAGVSTAGTIREQLHEERIRKAIDEKMDAVMSGLREIERKRSAARRQVVDKDPSLTSEQIAAAMKDVHQSLLDEMRELGEKLGLRFVRTGLLNRVDLAADDQTPLGLALGYTSGAPVADEVFSKFPQRDQWEDANLFASDRAVRNQFALSGDESHFAWWITEFSAAHIPNLEDAGIRDEVILTLKRQQARKLAEERGKTLAKLVSDGLALPEAERKSMSDSLQGQTVLGDTESAAAVVRQTQLFSWLEQESAPQMSFQQPQLRLGTINWSDESGGVLRSAGDRFMKTVFDDLGPDQTGVVADDELKSYYVVQVTDRIGDEDVLRQMFLTEGRQFGFRSGEISGLVSGLIAQPVMNDWRNTIWLKYGIDLSQMEE